MKDTNEIKARPRRWLFRLALILAPVLAFAALEALVRLTGAGMPTPDQIHNLNPVGLPLFKCVPTAGNARLCQTSAPFSTFIGPQKFTLPRPAGTVRIFCLGESVTAGYPFMLPGSFAKFLSVILAEERGRFEVINVGVQGIRSADIRIIADEIVRYDPNYLVIYMGNNEFLGLDPAAERGWKADLRDRGRRLLLRSRLYFAATARARLLTQDASRQSGLLRQTIESRELVSRRDWDVTTRAAVARRFEENLNGMIDAAEGYGARVVVATVASNLRSFPPFRDDDGWPASDGCLAPPPGAIPGPSAEAAAERDRCAANPGAGEPADAAEAYRRGCCALWAGDTDRARRLFTAARDADRLTIRATSALNDAVRRTALRRSLPLADVESLFAARSAWQIPGDDIFLDHVHPDLTGAALISQSIIQALVESRAPGFDPRLPGRMDRRVENHLHTFPPNFLLSSYFTDATHVIRYGAFKRTVRLYRRAAAADPSNPDAVSAAAGAERWAGMTPAKLKKLSLSE